MQYLRTTSMIIILFLLILFKLSWALTITALPTRPVWYDGITTLTINPRMQLTIEFWAEFESGDEWRMSWSSPFLFYGTGGVIDLYGPGAIIRDSAFDEIWDMAIYTNYRESWDGDLTNMDPGGDRPGDLFSYVGIGITPTLPSSGNMHLFDVVFRGINAYNGGNLIGYFCIDSGNAINSTYDWLWEPPSPSFGPMCWPVKMCPCGYIEFVNCPDTTIYVSWNDTLVMDFQTLSWSNFDSYYTILSDSTGQANLVITDPTNDPNGEVQFTYAPNIDDIGPHPILIGVYQHMNYYPTGYECTLNIEVRFICGDVNLDGLVNIFDITYLIEYLYLEGEAPNPMESADVNNDGATNIFDVTYLITYLYLEGPQPECP
jgi:hypothetical protein